MTENESKIHYTYTPTPGPDPRFQQQNQSLRCFVSYTDYHRCRRILGPDAESCVYFQTVYSAICPNSWIEKWDELRTANRLGWFKGTSQGPFPGKSYGS